NDVTVAGKSKSANSGDGEVELQYPQNIFIDEKQNRICVLDQGNHRFRMFSMKDEDNPKVIKYSLDEETSEVIMDPKESHCFDCRDICLDQQGTIYLSGYWNNRTVRRAKDYKTSTVIVDEKAATLVTSKKQLQYPSRMFIDKKEQLYVVDTDAGPGYRSNQLSVPKQLKFDSNGHLYVVDYDNHRIQRFNNDNSDCKQNYTVILNVSMADRGTYVCQNKDKKSSVKVTLNVKAAHGPLNDIAYVGENYRLTCYPTYNGTTQWLKDGKLLPTHSNPDKYYVDVVPVLH
ncbi:unnamed protein product, partial [Didymodactylos carnosus]